MKMNRTNIKTKRMAALKPAILLFVFIITINSIDVRYQPCLSLTAELVLGRAIVVCYAQPAQQSVPEFCILMAMIMGAFISLCC